MEESTRRWARGVLAVIGLAGAEVSVWALIAPKHFFEHFPGGGRHWLSALPPYNEHLLRDYAAGVFAVTVLALWAAVAGDRRLIQAALVASAALAAPHIAYHLTTIDSYSLGDNLASFLILGFSFVAPVVVLALMARARAAGPAAAVPPDRVGAR
jgi:hypothetical protein